MHELSGCVRMWVSVQEWVWTGPVCVQCACAVPVCVCLRASSLFPIPSLSIIFLLHLFAPPLVYVSIPSGSISLLPISQFSPPFSFPLPVLPSSLLHSLSLSPLVQLPLLHLVTFPSPLLLPLFLSNFYSNTQSTSHTSILLNPGMENIQIYKNVSWSERDGY